MIGPRPSAYACAYVDPVFTSQSYNISMSTSTSANLSGFSCAYAYAYVDPVFTCLHVCLSLCLCLRARENQALELYTSVTYLELSFLNRISHKKIPEHFKLFTLQMTL